MKNTKSNIMLCSILLIGTMAAAQQWTNPVIKDYGKIKFYEDAELIPDADTDYKMVFDLKSDSEMEGINKGLLKIARAINLLGASGVPKENIHLVGIIHGKSTPAVLSNTAYNKRKGKDNSNLDLLKVLTENNVKFYVCGQSLAHKNIDPDEMNEYVSLSLSALTSLSHFQFEGYALMP